MTDTSMPPNPSLLFHNDKIITYRRKSSMPKSFVKNEGGFPCLNRKPAKRGRMHPPQGCTRVGEVAMRWGEVEKDAIYGNIHWWPCHLLKLNPFSNPWAFPPKLASPLGDLRPSLREETQNSWDSLKQQHLACLPCPGTCQNDLPSHPTLFWQFFFFFNCRIF